MINKLKLKSKNIDDLEEFIRDHDNELYKFINNKKRSELIELKKDFKEHLDKSPIQADTSCLYIEYLKE